MSINGSRLYILSGLPGSGKTTLSKALASYLNAVYLRIDTIEQGLRELCKVKVEGEGYRLSYRIAADNLGLGNSVVADSCNPISLTRLEWQEVATSRNVSFVNIEVICSDVTEHQKRIESRENDMHGLVLPRWAEVEARQYDPWACKRIVIDTASKTVSESFNDLLGKVDVAT